MNISKEILDKLCNCEDLSCAKPHTIKELEAATGEKIIPKDDTTPNCPNCQINKNVYIYEYKGINECYCNNCNESFTMDGVIIPLEELFTPEPSKKKHTMIFDGHFYQCDECTFETAFMTEANQHENLSPNSLITNSSTTPTTPSVELHYTKWRKDSEWYCIYCPEVFHDFKKSLAHENDAGRKANNLAITTYKHCTHNPQEILRGEEHTEGKNKGQPMWSVYAGRKWDCENKVDDFDVVLNLSGIKLSKRHEIPIKELQKWESKECYKEICLDWPDRGIVSLPKEWWRDLTNYLKKNNYKMLVFCVGGHGRTGTAVASMLVVAFNYEPKEACEWVWNNYCGEAIETDNQIKYVYALAGQKYTPPTTSTTSTTSITTSTKNETKLFGATSGAGWDSD